MGINKEQKRYSSGIELKLKPLSTLTLFCPPKNEAVVLSSSCRGIKREREREKRKDQIPRNITQWKGK